MLRLPIKGQLSFRTAPITRGAERGTSDRDTKCGTVRVVLTATEKPKTSKICVLRNQRPRGDVFMRRAEQAVA